MSNIADTTLNDVKDAVEDKVEDVEETVEETVNGLSGVQKGFLIAALSIGVYSGVRAAVVAVSRRVKARKQEVIEVDEIVVLEVDEA